MFTCRHKTRLHIGKLINDTSAKLKAASEADHGNQVSVSMYTNLVDLQSHLLGSLV